MKVGAPGPFGAQLKALREAAGFTQEELATISGLSVHAVSALERGERRRPHVETVRGPGGVGKTRLLLELARATGEEGATRVVFVSLAAIRDSTFVAPAIAEALGLKDISAADLAMRAHVASGDQRTLLALDNFEHVLDAASLVVDLLTSVASLRLLVTSRAPLRVRGEREFAVGPLALQPGSEEMSLADLARVPAVHLVRGTGPGCAPRISTHPGQRFDCCRNLSTARCLAACARTGRPVDQSADARGPASPPRAGCLIGGARTARSSRAPTGDERDRRLELSVARP